MNLQHSLENKSWYGNHSLLFFLLACTASVSFFQVSYAQTTEQETLSDNLLNDPLAQDLLKKIEQTKKMIADLEQKEYEKNQAQEHLQQMREMSLERLNKNLDEWERLWEKQSSRNAFESFVNKKPEYVQGVFWDQFEFKEQKVNAGKIAMMQVLANGGTMQDAKEAYNNAASSKRVEIIEMNAQFNIKHNLASHAEQLIFDSAGKAHLSDATYNKLGNMYSDYRMQPNYILANQERQDSQTMDSEKEGCSTGEVMVLRLTSGNQSCVEESIAKKWIKNGIQGLKIVGEDLLISNVIRNPGTQCSTEHIVVYHLEQQEYLCVLESDAKEMVEQKTVELHTLIDYINSKDDLKKYEDIIYDINQKIQQFTAEYDLKIRMIKTEIGTVMEQEKKEIHQQISDAVSKYRDGTLTKEQISDKILEIENKGKDIQNQLSDKLQETLDQTELQYKQNLKDAVMGYEKNSDININWDYLINEDTVPVVKTDTQSENIKISISEDNVKSIQDNILLNDVSIVNSFGHNFDEIKADQILQISANISNLQNYSNDFAYVVQITDDENNITQPARWITGTLNPKQNFNVSLSWVPEKTGMYNATVSLGSSLDSVSYVADVKIDVNPEGDPTNENYCKNGHELLFKYSDNSPICVSDDTASKLINIGLAFT